MFPDWFVLRSDSMIKFWLNMIDTKENESSNSSFMIKNQAQETFTSILRVVSDTVVSKQINFLALITGNFANYCNRNSRKLSPFLKRVNIAWHTPLHNLISSIDKYTQNKVHLSTRYAYVSFGTQETLVRDSPC